VRARVDYAKRSREADDPDWDALISRLEAQIPRTASGATSRGLPKFTGKEGIVALLDATGYLQRAYVVLSRTGHVTDQAVTDYFIDQGDTVAVASRPSDEHDIDVFHTLATCCCLAAWLLARLEGDTVGLELAENQNLLWRLDTHLLDEQRRFPADGDGS